MTEMAADDYAEIARRLAEIEGARKPAVVAVAPPPAPPVADDDDAEWAAAMLGYAG